ncbi:MAG: class E sortase [Actinobacteria bacterium]|nr:class E sortase [Actinomycetota bacterium]
MHLKRSTLIASVVAVLLLAVIAFAYTGPSNSDGATNGSSDQSAAPESPQPKVERLLEELNNGEPSDAPVTKADVKKAKMPFAVRGDSNSPLGTIAMPSIGMQVKFYEGVVDEVVEKGPGHWPGTPLPGNTGNSVFAGHRTTFTAPFADFDLVNNGDVVRTVVGKNKPVNYKVYKTTIVPEAEYVDFVLKQPTSKRARTITMLACTPKGQRTHRIVVQARATKAPATTTQDES